jgi:hypothetical protein
VTGNCWRLSIGGQIRLALAAIIPVAAGASYLQALIVVRAVDGHGLVSWFVAGLADPTLFAASANINDARRKDQGWPWWSVLSAGVSFVVTVGANILASHPVDVPPWVVRAWPPVALLMALESLLSYVRRNRSLATDDRGRPVSTEDALRVLLATGSRRGLADALGVSRSRVETWAASTRQLEPVSLNGSAPDA